MSANIKKLLYILMILAGFAAALLVIFLLGRDYSKEGKKDIPYTGALLRYDGWSLREDGVYARVNLPAYVSPHGNTVTITNTLPRALESGTHLAFVSSNTLAVVKVDGEEVYRNSDSAVPPSFSMWNYIQMNAAQAEGRIEISFSGNDPYDTGILPIIYLGPRAEILLLAESETRLNTQIGVSTVFFGLFVILCSLVTFSDIDYSADFILLGLFVLVLGLSQWFQIVLPTENMATWFTRQGMGRSLFGLLPAFWCYYCARKSTNKAKRLYETVFWVGIGFFFLVYLLRWFGTPKLWPGIRVLTYVVFEGIFGLCLYSAVWLEKENSVRYRTLIGLGLTALMLGMGLENFTHVGYTYLRIARPMIIGALVFSVLQATAVLFNVFDHVEQQARIAQELHESQVRLMMNQLKPHFIRNSLATIRVITRHDPQKAYDLLYDFTRYLSYHIDSLTGNELTSFAEELGHIREYTNIEQEHMGERLTVKFDIGPTDFEIPPLSVEPFVENAVKHGVWPKRSGGTVSIASTEIPDAYVITIRDDGVGFDPANPPPPVLRSHGIGMKYAIERLKTMVNGAVQVDSEINKGTTVRISIPKKQRRQTGDETENDSGR